MTELVCVGVKILDMGQCRCLDCVDVVALYVHELFTEYIHSDTTYCNVVV